MTDGGSTSMDETSKRSREEEEDAFFSKSKKTARSPLTKYKKSDEKLDKIMYIIQEMKEELIEMRKDHKEYREDIKILRLENEKLRSEQEKVKKSDEKLDKIMYIIQEMKEELIEMRKDHKEYREDIKILRLENEKLRSEQEKVKKENEEIKKEILRLRNSMDHLERGKRERNIVLTGLQIEKEILRLRNSMDHLERGKRERNIVLTGLQIDTQIPKDIASDRNKNKSPRTQKRWEKRENRIPVEELEKVGIDILGITETKRKGVGEIVLTGGHLLIYSGVDKEKRASEGVACYIRKENIQYLRNWIAVSERILKMELDIDKMVETTIIVAYGPNEDEKAKVKDAFWEQLSQTTEEINGRLIILGDL
ncbi:hypothetical protein QE152_g38752, partial [Popillia japonica]